MRDHLAEIEGLTGVPVPVLRDFEKRMDRVAGRTGVLEDVLAANDRNVRTVLSGLGRSKPSEDIPDLLAERCLADDAVLKKFLKGEPGANEFEKAASLARRIARVGRGYFLKRGFAAEILRRRPPEHLLAFLGYGGVDELLAKHDVTEAFSALRFMESDEWMHETFERAYGSFGPADFEERDIELRVLGPEWRHVALKFVEKKHHNVSHLKEFGVIFLNPISEDMPGKFLRDFALLFHYFHEIEFYSKLFRRFSREPRFAANLKALLRGDVKAVTDVRPGEWLIVQRYFAKLDPKDPRLFVPRVNPESLHWRLGELDLIDFFSGKNPDLSFWRDLDWVAAGDASCDLEDNAMAAVSGAEGRPQRFVYHQREAVWLKIFSEYLGGLPELERVLLNQFEKGIINP